jgi:hypothetical protein
MFLAAKHSRQFLQRFVPFSAIELDALWSAVVRIVMGGITFQQFNFAVHPTKLFHLLHRVVR